MHTKRVIGLCTLSAMLVFGGCAGSAGGPSALPATAADTTRLVETQSILPATLSVTANISSVPAGTGARMLPCAAQITSLDPMGAYMVVAWIAPAVGNLLPAGTVSVAVPDLATPETVLNGGFPGRTLWQGARGETITHCVDVVLTPPATLAAGTYTANVQYTLLMNVARGLYATRAVQTAPITITVGSGRIR